MSANDLFWWEKSVEFAFLAQAIHEDCYVSPLDGWHELAGDAFLKDSDNRWILIEFKKNRESIKSEKQKFFVSGYEKAEDALKGKDSFHFLIFAEEIIKPNKETEKKDTSPSEETETKLCYRNYFSKKSQPDISKMLTQGTDKKNFDAYVKEYIFYKELSSEDEGGGQRPLQLSKAIDYGNVAFISPTGKLLNICRLDDYALANQLVVFVEPNHEKKEVPKPTHTPRKNKRQP